MPLYQYIKKKPKQKAVFSIFISFFMLFIGSGLLIWTFWPIVYFSLFTEPFLKKTISPLPEVYAVDALAIKNSYSTALSETLIQGKYGDYTNANVWFPTRPQKKIVTPVNSYKISIPKLHITDANVIIGGSNLDSSLIHYGGTSMPGDYGNTVIFGHSTLPQFFRPTDYHTIFSTLPTLAVGDKFFIAYDGVKYTYKVLSLTITDPNDLSPLEQHFDDSYVTLITCVPPGTYLKRLNVYAQLIRI